MAAKILELFPRLATFRNGEFFQSQDLDNPHALYRSSLFGAQLPRDLVQVLGVLDIENLPNLGRIPHQLLRTRIHHTALGITCVGEVVQEDVGDGHSAGWLQHDQYGLGLGG